MTEPTRLDWLVYRLFRWRWNPILSQNPRLLRGLVAYLQAWHEEAPDE